MKITRLRTQIVEIPFTPPIDLEAVMLASGGYLLVFLESDQGVVGEGMVFTFNGARLVPIDALISSFEPLIVGLDPHHSGAFAMNAHRSLRNFGRTGMSALARAGVETALYDLRAKLLDRNVAHMLGACRATMPCYQSSELWANLSPDAVAKAAAEQVAAGFRALKMRLSGVHDNDVARVRAVRDAVGPDVPLMADINQRLDVTRAIRLGRALEEFGLAWIEEPVPADDHAGEARVAAALDTAIASGESVYTSRGAMEMLQLRACDVLTPDLLRMGGPSEFLKAATLAEGFDIPVANHTYHQMCLPLLAAVPNAIWLEHIPWASPIYRESIEFDGAGNAIVPDRPGWGYSFDPAVIEKYAVT